MHAFSLKNRCAAALLLVFAAGAAFGMRPVTIVDQGSFAAGGTVVAARTAYDPYHPKAEGQTLHGDHAVVEYQVPENRYFVLGDHRSVSIDSRSSVIGCVEKSQVVGRVFLRIWPLNRFAVF